METTRASLLARIKDLHDTQAWREFDSLYRPMLYRFARSRGLDRASAEDVVQRCMATVVRQAPTFQYQASKGKFRNWLQKMAENKVRDLLRARRLRQADSKHLAALRSSEPSPEELFDKAWYQAHVRYCLEQVQADVQETTYRAFQLYAIEQRPVGQVCELLNMTPNQLYKIKWRVQQKVAKLMEAFVEEAAA
jgi:RNA polymerase sigma-70 factor (ECF subfamily)